MLMYLSNSRGFTLLVLILASLISSNFVKAQEIQGQIDWSQRVELSTPVKGVIKMINAEPGQSVKKGDILLQLDQRGFKARVDSLTAKLKQASAVRAEAKRELDRAETMYERTLLSQHELQVKKNDYIEAQANYDVCQAKLTQAKLDLEYSTIRAPYDAVVVLRQAEVGQTVISEIQAETLVVVAEAHRMQASGYLTVDQLGHVKLGQKAVVRTDGLTFDGKVSAIVPEPSPSRNKEPAKYTIRVIFTVGDKELRVGQSAAINL